MVSPVPHVTTVSPDSAKQKRKAPAPPPRPSLQTPPGSNKPESELPPQSPSLSTTSTPSMSPSIQKKRRAPPRPSYLPVKSQVFLQNSNQTKVEKENGESVHTNSNVQVDKNSPPVFIAPPPPEELPPPIDECATPVCPVDEDDFDTRSLTGTVILLCVPTNLPTRL